MSTNDTDTLTDCFPKDSFRVIQAKPFDLSSSFANTMCNTNGSGSNEGYENSLSTSVVVGDSH